MYSVDIPNNNDFNNNFEYLNWIDTSTYEKLLSTWVQYKEFNLLETIPSANKLQCQLPRLKGLTYLQH